MNKIVAGFAAGFAATVVLSILMIAKGMMGLMPGLNVIVMLSTMMGAPAIMGWVAHFMIGTIAWGGAFAVLYERLPGGSALGKGIVLSIAAWLAMMVVVMPMAGAGLFGMHFGIMGPMMTLILHVIFGAVLGAVFQMFTAPKPAHN